MQAISNIETVNAKRYLGQFAKHFGHKIPVELAEDNSRAKVAFGRGICRMQADDAKLSLELEAEGDEMANLQDVVAQHLLRFAFREALALNWQHVLA